MSLQIWLPLNGNLNNQGLQGEMTFSQKNTTITTNGKIGNNCYNFNGSSGRIYGDTVLPNSISNTVSIACWAKIDSTATSNGYLCGLSKDNANFMMCYYYSSSSQLMRIYYGGSSRTTFNLNGYMDAWHHYACISTGEKLLFYIDGELKKEITYAGDALGGDNHFCIGSRNAGSVGTGSIYFKGQMNDVRFYDHALSAKEVEEISKGLILHYKLDDRFCESTVNLSNKLSSTAYNGSTGKYGYNETSNLQKTSGFFQGKQCEKVSTIVEGQSARPYVYIDNMFVSSGGSYPLYKTLSFDYFPTIGTYINPYRLGSGSSTATYTVINSNGVQTGSFTNSGNIPIVANEWNHIEIILQGTTTDSAQWGYIINGAAHTSAATSYYLFANIQLEEKDHTTGYTPTSRTTNTIYDSSGYNNDGEQSNVSIVSSSSRYDAATNFSNSAYIKVIDNKWMAEGIKEMTINLWAKASSWPASGHLFSCTESGGFNLEAGSSGYWRFPIDVYTNSAQTSATYKYDSQEVKISDLPVNKWVMLTLIYDGTGTKTYINGELHHTYANVSYGIHFNTNARLFLACEANGASPYSPYFTGQMSDFRIYNTVLTPEQIKELYNISATIDNDGNIYARELVE